MACGSAANIGGNNAKINTAAPLSFSLLSDAQSSLEHHKRGNSVSEEQRLNLLANSSKANIAICSADGAQILAIHADLLTITHSFSYECFNDPSG